MKSLGLHAFCSVKGGVGKSTLAITTAKLLARRGAVPVVVDADMLGASLADGLRLCAPVVNTTTEGLLDLDAPPTGKWYSLDETRALREQRRRWLEGLPTGIKEVSSCPPPAYLNDALNYPVPDPARECSVFALLWKHGKDDGVWYLPSSPLRGDAAAAAPYALGMPHGFHWVRRLSWLLDALLGQQSDITDFVVDLPPGTWGFAQEVLVWFGALVSGKVPSGYPRLDQKRALTVNPFIVTSQDRNDRVLAMEYWLYARPFLPPLALLCNRVYESRDEVRRQVKRDFVPALQGLGIEDTLRFVPTLPRSLGRVFVEGDLEPEELAELEAALRLQPRNIQGRE